MVSRNRLAIGVVALMLAGCQTSSSVAPGAAAAPPAASSEWLFYDGSLGSNQYSPLTQINKTNVDQLVPVWDYATGDVITNAAPLIADGLMYVISNGTSVAALDPATGQEIWKAENIIDRTRGFSYWRSADGKESRILFFKDQTLRAIDAKTGTAIADFGGRGFVDLREGLNRDVSRIGSIQPVTPGKVVGDIIILGANTGEGYGAPPGDIRAFNVRTGQLAWQFHVIPHPGEPGYETWEDKNAWKTAGGVNSWGGMSVDETLGIAYLGLGSATYDFWGGDRKGTNLYANSLIALDIKTGKLVWHYQTVHHDLWDYDLTSSPVLMQITRDGKPVDVVVQAAKTGFLFVFDRATGKPVFPIEERPVPKSDLPGEIAWPTQPHSTLPSFARQRFTEADVDPALPEDEKRAVIAQILGARNDGLFTPPGLRDTVQMPGNHGGVNWGMTAGEPKSGRFYVSSFDLPTMLRLAKMSAQPVGQFATPKDRGRALFGINCAICHGDDMEGIPPVPVLRGVTTKLGIENTYKTIRNGRSTMPAFAGSLSDADINAIVAYLADPTPSPQAAPSGGQTAQAADAHGATGQDLNAPGEERYYSSYGFMISAKSFLPVIRPPWTTITAYDLNLGKILWQVPLGGVPDYPVAQTGVSRSKGGLVVTEGGLIFASSSDDRKIHAYDRDTGKLLWEAVLPSIPQGVPAIYQVRGRQYLAVAATYYPRGGGMTPVGPARGPAGSNRYVVFALPERKAEAGK